MLHTHTSQHHPLAGLGTELFSCFAHSPIPAKVGWEKEPELVPSSLLLSHRLQFRVKKEGWGGGGTRSVTFSRGSSDLAVLKASGRTLTVSVGDGLPKSSSESAGSRGRSQRGTSTLEEAGPVKGGANKGTNQDCGGGASEAAQEWTRVT
jgi:hypothetical protein